MRMTQKVFNFISVGGPAEPDLGWFLPFACVGVVPSPWQLHVLVIPSMHRVEFWLCQVCSVQVMVPLGLCRIVPGIFLAFLTQCVQNLHKSGLSGARQPWELPWHVPVGCQSLGWSAGSPRMELWVYFRTNRCQTPAGQQEKMSWGCWILP